MNADSYRRMIDYSYWAHRRVWASVMQLTDEQFDRPCDYSIGSLHAQLVHTMDSERLWLERLQGKSPNPRFEPTEAYPTRESIRAKWDEVEANWREFAAALTDEQLQQPFTFTSITTGRQQTQLLWEGLTQILNHATDHRAQMLFLIHQLGGATDAQDFIFYAWENPL